jgi:hypothetical protein
MHGALISMMTEDRKRCENCWVMVGMEVDVCPNCSHPFPPEEPAGGPGQETKKKEPLPMKIRPLVGRPFRFITLSLLSFIAILTFMNAEGLKLSGLNNGNYIPLDLVGLIPASMLLAAILSYIDYRIDD